MTLIKAYTKENIFKVIHQTHNTLCYDNEKDLFKYMKIAGFKPRNNDKENCGFWTRYDDKSIDLLFSNIEDGQSRTLCFTTLKKKIINSSGKSVYMFHRDNDQPAFMKYNINGDIEKIGYFFNDKYYRSFQRPDTIDYLNESLKFCYSNYQNIYSNEKFSLVNVSFSKENHKIIDGTILIELNNKEISVRLKRLFEYFPRFSNYNLIQINQLKKYMTKEEFDLLSILYL